MNRAGGLYVIGHVKVANLDDAALDPCIQEYPRWLSIIDELKLKAFVELTMARSVREGMHHLIRVSGLGGMKPNTICLGFCDEVQPQDTYLAHRQPRKPRRFIPRDLDDSDGQSEISEFPSVRGSTDDKLVNSDEYIAMLQDIVKMKKNVCLFRFFQKLDKKQIMRDKRPHYIDVWPVNFFRPESSQYFDSTCLFLLQLACILHMTRDWCKRTRLRIFVCVEEQAEDTQRKRKKLQDLLEQLRIIGEIVPVPWQHVTSVLNDTDYVHHDQSADVYLPDDYITRVNQLVLQHSGEAAVLFLYLPKVPMERQEKYNYLRQLDRMTSNLPPTVLVHGIRPVTSTTL